VPRLAVWIVRTALIYLGCGFTVGAYMLINKGLRLDPHFLAWVYMHEELLLIGWMLQFVIGVAFWILPRFMTAPKYGAIEQAWAAYIVLNMGVLTTIVGTWIEGPGSSAALIGRGLEIVAAATFAVYIWPRVRPFLVG